MRTGLLGIAVVLATAGWSEARMIYVDSRVGNNAYDGTSAEPVNAWVGPVRTLERAMQLVDCGDSLVLVDNGTPYYGSLTMFGAKFSGTPDHPFYLHGGGAVVSGAKPIEPGAWVELGNNLWKITPVRKGWYQLVDNGEAVPRVEITVAPAELPDVPVGSWGVHKGTIYYRSKTQDTPRQHDFALAETATGLTLLGVRNVVVSDLTLRHFRVDGINAHNRCENVQFNNVSCVENGRAGIVVSGTSQIDVNNSEITRNQQHSLLITEFGQARLDGTEYDRPPTVED